MYLIPLQLKPFAATQLAPQNVFQLDLKDQQRLRRKCRRPTKLSGGSINKAHLLQNGVFFYINTISAIFHSNYPQNNSEGISSSWSLQHLSNKGSLTTNRRSQQIHFNERILSSQVLEFLISLSCWHLPWPEVCRGCSANHLFPVSVKRRVTCTATRYLTTGPGSSRE